MLRAVVRDAAGNTTASPRVAVTVSNGRNRVQWTQLVNATAIGKVLSKAGGCNGCTDAGALSAQTIVADGYFEFRASETSSLRLVGLGKRATRDGRQHRSSSASYSSLGVIVEVQEMGASRFETTFAPGDLFRITIAGAAVLYTQNSILIHQGALVAPSPLRVRASLYSTASTITGAWSPFHGDRPRPVARWRPKSSENSTTVAQCRRQRT